MKKTILVIGGNGFIGTNLSYMLAEEGNDVISFDLVRPARENPKIQYIEGDFFDDQILEKITENSFVPLLARDFKSSVLLPIIKS